MACCLLCEFYGYTLEQVCDLTFTEFDVLMDGMNEIQEMKNGNSKSKAEPGVTPDIPPDFNNFVQRKKE